MPTFIKIAHEERNIGGITSKGYWIFKRENTVRIEWGAIISRSRKFYWAGLNLPQTTKRTFATTEEATYFYNDKVRRIRNEEYSKLPSGVRILKYPKR